MAIFYNMVNVSALNALLVYLSLNQGAFGSTARSTRRSLLIQMGKDLVGYENQQPSSTVACQLGDNKDMPSGPPQKKRCYVCPSEKDRKTKTWCTMPQKCPYRTFCCRLLLVPKIVSQHFHVPFLCFPLDKFQVEFFICQLVRC